MRSRVRTKAFRQPLSSRRRREDAFDALPKTASRLRLVMKHLLPGEDVAVETLFRLLYPDHGSLAYRLQQQYVGSFITKLNRRIGAYQIVIRPGIRRHTYRLYDRAT